MSARKNTTERNIAENIKAEKKAKDEKRYVMFLSPEDRTIKQNVRYLLSTLIENEYREKFIKAIDIEESSLLEFKALDRKIVPSNDTIKKIESYFESEYDMGENGCDLRDKDLLLKLSNMGINVATSIRNTERIKSNIQNLRKYFHETQKQLADAIGVQPSAIANYEDVQNSKMPNQEKLIAIARHYRITVDELLNLELELFPLKNANVKSKDNIGRTLEKLLPYVEYHESVPQEARNIKTLDACAIHEELLYHVVDNTLGEHMEEVEECLELYESAIEEGDAIAAANQLWWLMLFGMTLCGFNDNSLENLEKNAEVTNNVLDWVKMGWLIEPLKSHLCSDCETKNLRQEFLKNCEKQIVQDIYVLKQSGCCELADYYTAFRYTFGVVRNNLTRELNRAIGHELMRSFGSMRNEYVKDFYSILDNLTEC